jgi:hypothetical protein
MTSPDQAPSIMRRRVKATALKMDGIVPDSAVLRPIYFAKSDATKEQWNPELMHNLICESPQSFLLDMTVPSCPMITNWLDGMSEWSPWGQFDRSRGGILSFSTPP